jgi:SpoVK/Ycf46/Vps4 family AAA+-type ATPase
VRRFAHGQLIEVNAHSLFSKWFSESGKLVSRLFAKIMELVGRAPPLHMCVPSMAEWPPTATLLGVFTL